MTKRKAGRPTKYNPELVERLVTAIKLGAPFTHACNYAGIAFETFMEWRRKYPEFTERIKAAEGGAVVQWLAKIEKAAAEGNWQAMAWKLERRYPEEFGRRDRITVDVQQLDADIERELAIILARGEDQTTGETTPESIH